MAIEQRTRVRGAADLHCPRRVQGGIVSQEVHWDQVPDYRAHRCEVRAKAVALPPPHLSLPLWVDV